MSSNVVNQMPFLRTTRSFPEDISMLTLEINKTYVDTANAVNLRTIGLFPINRPAITGESWFINLSQRQQSLRQVYNITSFAAFNHGIDFNEVFTFSVIRGIAFDGTNYYPIPFVDPTAANQIGISVTPTQVVFTPGGGAPAIVRGIILLEWISQV